MSATSLSPSGLPSVHQQFVAALPRMNRTFGFHFRGLRFQERKEAAAEARAAAWAAWHGLLRRGKDPLAVGVVGIANACARHVKGNHKRSQGSVAENGAHDARRGKVQARRFRVISFDDVATARNPSWRDWITADNRCTPADEAAFRLDFAEWLTRLPERKRRMAELLAQGHETGVVAELLDVTPGAVSQSRAWLANNWRGYQGEHENGSPQSTTPRPGVDANPKRGLAAQRP
jgi:hypothetical protein